MQYIKRQFIPLMAVAGIILLVFTSCGGVQSPINIQANASVSPEAGQLNDAEEADFDWSAIGEISAVEAGGGYSLLLNAENELYGWGGNSDYVLGKPGVVSLTPEIVMDDVISMSAGSSHAGAVTSDQTLWLWGNNSYNQLGTPSEEKSAAPVKAMSNVQDVVCADGFTVVLDAEGTVWTFGRNHAGQLGTGSAGDSAAPAEVIKDAVKIAAGDSFVLALKNDGTVWGWGAGNYGQLLGYSDSSVNIAGQQIQIQSSPVKLLDNIKDISCGAGHALALDMDDNLYTWGLNTSGQLGNNGAGTWVDVNFGGRELFASEPGLIMTDVKHITGGAYNSAAIKSDDTLWLWGSNAHFQIGDGTSASAPAPVQVMENVLSVSVSGTHVMALTTEHLYFAWGSNENNILGDGNPTEIYEPVKIMDNVKSASIYSGHSLAVTSDNTLYAFGDNSMGQLGTGDFLNTSVPSLVMSDVQTAAAGAQHSICLKTDGTVWTWGSNTFGQIGNGQAEDVYSAFGVWRGGHPVWADASGNETNTVSPISYKPAQVFENAADISAKWHTSYAISKDGALYGWGWNELYQLGNDTRLSTASPLNIMDGVKALIPSYALIKNDGALWTWGSNPKDPYNILPAEALADAQSAAVLDRQFLAVKSDGTLWIWGQSVSGELIDSDDYFNTVEEPVQIGTQVKEVFACYGNIFVLDTDGALWALQSNQMAVKATDSLDSDVFTYSDEYKVMRDVVDVSVGLESVLVLKNDGTLWGFGSNEYGQLGGGLRFFTPQQISK